jgi:hypothetical protein
MSLRRLSEKREALYATSVPLTDGTRDQIRPTSRAGSPARPASATLRGPSQAATGAVDHWSVLLFYSMGFGATAVGILLFAVLLIVSLYELSIWTFTGWDLVSVRLTPFKSLAYLIIIATFVGGMCGGLWCFSGAAWRNRRPARAGTTSRRTVR